MGDVVVAFAFGAPSNISANNNIAILAILQALRLSAPIYTQQDVDIWHSTVKVATHENSGDAPTTLQIARGAVHWANQRGAKRLWVAAAKPHLRRCVRDLKFAIYEANAQIDVCVCEDECYEYEYEQWFCPDSAQERTRSFYKWWPREVILRLIPQFLYERVVG